MFKCMLTLVLSISAILVAEDKNAEDKDVAVIITNYQYDQYGRPIRSSQAYPNSNYRAPAPAPGYNPYYSNPYYTPYYYYPEGLPGADPNRFEDLFDQNSRK